jgi:hypothetical protein
LKKSVSDIRGTLLFYGYEINFTLINTSDKIQLLVFYHIFAL